MTLFEVEWALIKIVIMIAFVLNVAGLLTWVDRRQSAMIQDRIGPNRAVIKVFGKELRLAGLLHTAADGVKFFFKEDFMPPNADKLLFSAAPILAVASVFALLAGIPFGGTLCVDHIIHHGADGWSLPSVVRSGICAANPKAGIVPVELMVAPLNVGILYIFAVSGQGVIAAAIAGWSSDNKFSLMGALRAASQMVSYEVTIGLSIIGAMMIYGGVRLDEMVRWQGEHTWGIFVQPVTFFLFFAACLAENKRIPFDLPEAESELVSGYFTEYAGMKFGMFYFAEYAEIVTMSMLIVTIFLGGWELPFLHPDGLTIQFGSTVIVHQAIPHLFMTLIAVVTFFAKTLFVCWVKAFIRWSLPRFRYDQLMKLGWKIMLPISLVNILVTGCVTLLLDQAGAEASEGLRIAADVTQALVALSVTVGVIRLILGFFAKREHKEWIVGSSATFAAQAGGTKPSAMQA